MSARGPMGCAGPEIRGRAAHWSIASWLLAAVWLVLAWTALTPAQALPRIGFDPSLAVQRDHVPGNLPRQLEADLPDLVDTAHPVQFDSDAAISPPVVVAAVTIALSRDEVRPPAVPTAPFRVFNPRAPPSLP